MLLFASCPVRGPGTMLGAMLHMAPKRGFVLLLIIPYNIIRAKRVHGVKMPFRPRGGRFFCTGPSVGSTNLYSSSKHCMFPTLWRVKTASLLFLVLCFAGSPTFLPQQLLRRLQAASGAPQRHQTHPKRCAEGSFGSSPTPQNIGK